LWYDPWLHNGTLLQLTSLASPPTLSEAWKVSHSITNGYWSIKEPVLQNFLQIIKQVHISANQDSWVWTASGTRTCALKYAWDVTREEGCVSDLFSIVWQPNIATKMSICLLRAIHNKLLWLLNIFWQQIKVSG